MRVFADTSALYALLDRDDENHVAARTIWARLLDDPKSDVVTHNYVLVELVALVQRRLGSAAVRDLIGSLLPVVGVVWIDERLHARAVAALLAAESRRISLVDRVSFEVMRDLGLTGAFAFDDDFAREGFALLVTEPESDA